MFSNLCLLYKATYMDWVVTWLTPNPNKHALHPTQLILAVYRARLYFWWKQYCNSSRILHLSLADISNPPLMRLLGLFMLQTFRSPMACTSGVSLQRTSALGQHFKNSMAALEDTSTQEVLEIVYTVSHTPRVLSWWNVMFKMASSVMFLFVQHTVVEHINR